MLKRATALTCALLVALAAAGCGSERGEAPELGETAGPEAFQQFVLPGGDVTFPYPSNWALIQRGAPGVATVASGGASATVWAYRSAASVGSVAAAQGAKDRLVASLEQRDPKFKLSNARATTIAGTPAVVIEGATEIAGRPVRVRSVHLYRGPAEYVVDAFADPKVFARADREVFAKLVAGLRFGGQPQASGPTPETTTPGTPPETTTPGTPPETTTHGTLPMPPPPG